MQYQAMLNQSLRRLILAGLATSWPVMTVSLAAESEQAKAPPTRKLFLDWDTGANKSTAIPTFEIPGFLAALNLYDRSICGSEVYGTTARSTWDHLRKQAWEFDEDPFNVNQFSHPYQGATMFGSRDRPASISGSLCSIATWAASCGRWPGRQGRRVPMT